MKSWHFEQLPVAAQPRFTSSSRNCAFPAKADPPIPTITLIPHFPDFINLNGTRNPIAAQTPLNQSKSVLKYP